MDDYVLSIDRLGDLAQTLSAFPRRILERVIIRLWQRLEGYLLPGPRPSTEQQALSLIKSIAGALVTAGKALDMAAYRLREAGHSRAAAEAKQAAGAAFGAAEGYA